MMGELVVQNGGAGDHQRDFTFLWRMTIMNTMGVAQSHPKNVEAFHSMMVRGTHSMGFHLRISRINEGTKPHAPTFLVDMLDLRWIWFTREAEKTYRGSWNSKTTEGGGGAWLLYSPATSKVCPAQRDRCQHRLYWWGDLERASRACFFFHSRVFVCWFVKTLILECTRYTSVFSQYCCEDSGFRSKVCDAWLVRWFSVPTDGASAFGFCSIFFYWF